jgi:hypothetical protein
MKIPVDDRLRQEAERFQLRHTCDDCIYFTGEACIHGYPTAEHRLPVLEAELIVFCKELDLGP